MKITFRNDAKYYSGQALAIVLIVLIVAIIIALALVSRSQKDRESVSQERISSESLEVADSMINVVSSIDYETVAQYCAGLDGAECVVSSTSAIESFLRDSTGDPSYLSFFSDFNKCFGDDGRRTTSDVELRFEPVGDDEVEIAQDSSISIITNGEDFSSCSMGLMVRPLTDSQTGIVTYKTFAQYAGDNSIAQIGQYDYSDSQGYCLRGGCGGASSWYGSWTNHDIRSALLLSFGPKPSDPSYKLNELRVRAVGGDVAVRATTISGTCPTLGGYIKVTASATCNGEYRGLTYLMPKETSALPVFDYVLYNGTGPLQQDN